MLIAAFMVHVALFLAPAISRREIRHDDGITLLAVTGHQGEYQGIVHADAQPHRAFVPAREWQKRLAMDSAQPPSMQKIGRDLAEYDIHPPLYFWMFSWVARTFGATLAVGLGLNLVLNVLAMVGIFFLANIVVRDKRSAALATILFGISPGVLETSLELRQYALAGTLTPLFGIAVVRHLEGEKPLGLLPVLWLVIVCALGVLIHYHFLLLIAAGCVLSMFGAARASFRRAATFCGLSVLGAGIGLAAFPHFFEIIKRQGSQAQRFVLVDIPIRIGGVFVAMGRFFVWSVPLIVLWMIALFVIVALLVRARRSLAARVIAAPPAMRRMVALLGLTFAAQAALFVSFRSPSGAMRAKYLVFDYPFVACLVAWMLMRPNVHPRAKHAVIAVLAVSSLVLGIDEIRRARQVEDSLAIATSARRIVLDTVERGSLPVALWNVPPETPVYAASLHDILARAADVRPMLEPGTLLVLDPQRADAESRARLVQLVPAQYRVDELRPASFRGRIVLRIVSR